MDPVTRGIDHVGLTVADLDEAVSFFTGALGFSVVGGRPSYPAVFVSDGRVMVTLWRASEPSTANPFDRLRNVGLHHLALRLDSVVELDRLYLELAARDDVTIEFPPEPLGGGPAAHMMLHGPSGIRIELIARPTSPE